ncbi:MAG: amidohydrolase family protein [Paludibacteraceae bacterium]|nr:amidohydrolase family protein [Paludibacteraceae bacterium]
METNYKEYIKGILTNTAHIIDTHTHIGVAIGKYVKGLGGYCQSLEELRLKMLLNEVDLSFVFPFPEMEGNFLSNIKQNNGQIFTREDFDYQLSNLNMVNEIINKHYNMFIPFMIINPKNNTDHIINFFKKNNQYLFGFKIHTKSNDISPEEITDCKFLDFCKSNKLPIIFHSRACDERYSYHSILKFAKKNPSINVCVAHAAGFDKHFYSEIQNFNNVYFDVSPLLYLCKHASDGNKNIISKEPVDIDFENPREVLYMLYTLAPQKILWATDEPCGRSNSHTYKLQVDIIKQMSKNVIAQIKKNTIKFLYHEEI